VKESRDTMTPAPADDDEPPPPGSLGLAREKIVVVGDSILPLGLLVPGDVVVFISPRVPGGMIPPGCGRILGPGGVTGWVPTRYIRFIRE